MILFTADSVPDFGIRVAVFQWTFAATQTIYYANKNNVQKYQKIVYSKPNQGLYPYHGASFPYPKRIAKKLRFELI